MLNKSSGTIFGMMLDGIRKFRHYVQEERPAYFKELAKRQDPCIIFITCADSRVSPERILDVDLGNVFIIRSAGNIVTPHDAPVSGETASIEYAIRTFDISHIVVCGHSGCGAVEAMFNIHALDNLPLMQKWLEQYAPPLKSHLAQHSEDCLKAGIEENVLYQLENLRTFPTIQKRIQEGKTQLHAWVYDIASGEVSAFDKKQNKYVNLIEPPASQVHSRV